jgi:L-fucose mutarotase
MPLIGVPASIHPELLYALARMGHGDTIVIADAHFPSDSIANSTVIKTPLRVRGTTAEVLRDILKLFPIDQYEDNPVRVMQRVPSDEAKRLHVPAYSTIASACSTAENKLGYVERFEFYEQAKRCFAVVQTDDVSQYANVIVYKGVVH